MLPIPFSVDMMHLWIQLVWYNVPIHMILKWFEWPLINQDYYVILAKLPLEYLLCKSYLQMVMQGNFREFILFYIVLLKNTKIFLHSFRLWREMSLIDNHLITFLTLSTYTNPITKKDLKVFFYFERKLIWWKPISVHFLGVVHTNSGFLPNFLSVLG